VGTTVAAGGAAGSPAGSGGAMGMGGAGNPGVGGSGGTQGGTSMAGAGAGGGPAGSAGAGGAGGSGTGGVGAICTSNDVCKAGLFCKKLGCALDLLGRCAARPATCAFLDSPVCGCDGITYLNSCLADMNGQNFSTRTICGDNTALKCTPGDKTCEIRPNGYCVVIAPDFNACGQVQDGQCWVVAKDCVATGTHYDSCDFGNRCVHSCDVAKDGKPYFPDPDCGG
jgi:hypothetical protein